MEMIAEGYYGTNVSKKSINIITSICRYWMLYTTSHQ